MAGGGCLSCAGLGRSRRFNGGELYPIPTCPGRQLFTLQRGRYVTPRTAVLLSSFRTADNGGEVGKRILIVDDGEEVRQVMRAVIEARTGYEVCGEASNGAEAVQKALALKPDL